MLKKKKTTASGELVAVKSVCKNAQPQIENLCSKGAWGRCPQQAKQRGKSRQDFSLCGPSVLTPALLATFVRKQYPYPLHDDLLLLS